LIRYISAFVIIAVCIVAIIQGVKIIRFTQLEISHKTEEIDAFRPWVGTAGVTAAALADLLKLAQKPADRNPILLRFLAERPLSSADWLSLAGMRLALGRPNKEILAALSLSLVTGPDEGGVMWQRGVFSLLAWERLSTNARDLAVTDLSRPLVDGMVGDAGTAPAKGILATKSPEARSQIKSQLATEGVSEKMLERLGL
jgi:hypothetical protein